METAIFSRSAVAEQAQISAVIGAVEGAFAAHAADRTMMPAKSYIDLPQYNGDFRSMPAYVDAEDWDAAGMKWVNSHPDNPDEHGLPSVMGVMVYSDPETALPLAIMDGMELTRQRTGAAAAVATDHLADPEASRLGLVGAGGQSYAQVEAIATVRPIREIVVHDVDEDAVSAFVDRFDDRFTVTPGAVQEAGHCDVLTTVTPVREPIVGPEDVGPGTHINAMGADAAGKRELALEVLREATIVIDDYEQCTHSGEINVPWSNGDLTDADLHGTLGEVVIGDVPGRLPLEGVTVFDSTGLAIQDIAAARVIYEDAGEDVPTIDLFERTDHSM